MKKILILGLVLLLATTTAMSARTFKAIAVDELLQKWIYPEEHQYGKIDRMLGSVLAKSGNKYFFSMNGITEEGELIDITGVLNNFDKTYQSDYVKVYNVDSKIFFQINKGGRIENTACDNTRVILRNDIDGNGKDRITITSDCLYVHFYPFNDILK